LIDKFLQNALETESDAISDGTDVFVPAVMEHIEYAGIHSGDSACVIPPVSLSKESINTINEYTKLIAKSLKVKGLMNIQYAIENGKVYVLEANPRASRTVPLVSKVCNINMVKYATGIMLGKTLKDYKLEHKNIPHFGVKEAVFPFTMFPEVDPVLGPEMRSTGEVLGMAESFGLAFYKAQEGAKQFLPLKGNVLISVNKKDREESLKLAGMFNNLNFKIYATKGTHKFLTDNNIKAEMIFKLHEDRPNIVDRIMNNEIHLIINTPAGKNSEYDDSYIRKNAIKYRVPYITTIQAAYAAIKGIEKRKEGEYSVKQLQEYHKGIK